MVSSNVIIMYNYIVIRSQVILNFVGYLQNLKKCVVKLGTSTGFRQYFVSLLTDTIISLSSLTQKFDLKIKMFLIKDEIL